MNLYENIYDFFSQWLFNGMIGDASLINIGGLIQLDLTPAVLVNALTITFIIIMIGCALWLCKWFINFIMGLVGGIND